MLQPYPMKIFHHLQPIFPMIYIYIYPVITPSKKQKCWTWNKNVPPASHPKAERHWYPECLQPRNPRHLGKTVSVNKYILFHTYRIYIYMWYIYIYNYINIRLHISYHISYVLHIYICVCLCFIYYEISLYIYEKIQGVTYCTRYTTTFHLTFYKSTISKCSKVQA